MFRSISIRVLRCLVAALLLMPLAGAQARIAQPAVDDIITRHIKARGGEGTMRAIRSLVFSKGLYEEPGFKGAGNATMMLMRPYLKLVGDPAYDRDFMEGYDGAAWEWYGDPGFVIRTVGPASQASRHNADVDSPFLDYRAKGSKVELIGSEPIDGRPAFNVRLTMRDGYATENFIDQKTYRLVAQRHSALVHAFGDRVTSQTVFRDFHPVAGVLFPFRSEEVALATGKMLNAMQWRSIEANIDIPVRYFSPPDFVRTPVQTLIEQLIIQREEADAVMWTYHAFRRAHPNVDTRDAIQAAGYQILKMGRVESSIALLEQNARDYPENADSAFALGRAYATAARKAEARTQFERALKLKPGHERAVKALKSLDVSN